MPDKPTVSQIQYNGLVVIQSLVESEPQTGQKLYEDIISRRCDLRVHGKYFYNGNNKTKDNYPTLNRADRRKKLKS